MNINTLYVIILLYIHFIYKKPGDGNIGALALLIAIFTLHFALLTACWTLHLHFDLHCWWNWMLVALFLLASWLYNELALGASIDQHWVGEYMGGVLELISANTLFYLKCCTLIWKCIVHQMTSWIVSAMWNVHCEGNGVVCALHTEQYMTHVPSEKCVLHSVQWTLFWMYMCHVQCTKVYQL